MAEKGLNMPECVGSITLKIPQSYSRIRIASNVQDGALVKIFDMVL